ncbi:hypothetical protein ACFOVU_14575 [Nocardiopsis sediminis]|uniref:Uncharacterized protein n=1 Tax=Nocardiopsis sediminis TaxID=1778267 RepID=A0ABV8FR95_9ACTN
MVDEVTIAIAAAVAGKFAESFTEGAKTLARRLRPLLKGRSPEAHDALEAARDVDGEDAVLVEEVAGHLAAAERDDSDVREILAELRSLLGTEGHTTVNTITGAVSGSVVQAGTIHGDLNFGRGRR